MTIVMDLTDVQDLKPLPAAVYVAELSAVQFVTAAESNSGKPYTKMTFQVLEGEYGGRKIVSSAPWIFKQLLNATGHSTEPGPDGRVVVEVEEEELLNQLFSVRVGITTYNGAQRNDIKALMPFTDGGGFVTPDI